MRSFLNEKVNESVPIKDLEDCFRNIVLEKHTNAELKKSLDDLEKLVVARTLQYAKTIEQLKQENFQRRQAEDLLQRRDAILEAVSFAAQEFMLKPEWQAVASSVLERLGRAAEVSRIYIFQSFNDSQGALRTSQLFEWSAPEIKPLIDNPALQNLSFAQHGFGQWQKILERGKSVFGMAREFSKDIQKILRTKNIQYIVLVPIMIEEKMWGLIGFDQCIVEDERSKLEIEALKTAANVLAAAIRRQQQDEILRKSRTRYRAVVDSQTEMICRFDDNGILTFVNDAYCRYLTKQREELVGIQFFPFHNKLEHKRIVRLLSSLSPDNLIGNLEHIHKTPDQEIRWQKWSYRKIQDGSNFLGEYQAVGWDISDRKRAEMQLQVALEEQEKIIQERTDELRIAYEGMVQSEKMAALGILTSEIAHEINNPNNFITFNIPILEDYLHHLIEFIENSHSEIQEITFFSMTFSEFKEDVLKLLQNIHNGSSRINNTVSRLRMFARPDDIRDLEKVDLRSILMQSIEFCQAKTKRTVKSLTFDVARNFPEIISNSHSLLHTMVNLLINAAQSADKNDSWIKICVMQNEPSPDHIVIRVEDNGCGMASNTKQKIFDPFFTTKAKGVGTGLGLYISQSLINALGGYIKVESEPGKGSRFDVILPAKYTNTA